MHAKRSSERYSYIHIQCAISILTFPKQSYSYWLVSQLFVLCLSFPCLSLYIWRLIPPIPHIAVFLVSCFLCDLVLLSTAIILNCPFTFLRSTIGRCLSFYKLSLYNRTAIKKKQFHSSKSSIKCSIFAKPKPINHHPV